MTRSSILLTAVLFLVLAGWRSDAPTRLSFTEASALWVTGTSTLHDWRCDAEAVDGWLEANLNETLTGIAGAEVTVPSDGLECKKGTMNKKARKALAAEDHPTIRFELTTVDVTPGAERDFLAHATGELTIAGQTRSVETEVQGELTDDGKGKK